MANNPVSIAFLIDWNFIFHHVLTSVVKQNNNKTFETRHDTINFDVSKISQFNPAAQEAVTTFLNK